MNHTSVTIALLVSLLVACKSDAPSGTPEERACREHMAQRARSKVPNGKPEIDRCVTAMRAMKPRVQETGFVCATSCLVWSTADVLKAETCVIQCELAHPKDGVDKEDPAFQQATIAIWDLGVVGDSPSHLEARLEKSRQEAAARAATQVDEAAEAKKQEVFGACASTCSDLHPHIEADYTECKDECKRAMGY